MLTSTLYQELIKSGFKENFLPHYRLYCHAFRSGGYMDVINQKIDNLKKEIPEVKDNIFLSQAEFLIKQILALREEIIPDSKSVMRRFLHYDRLYNGLITNLEKAREIDKEFKKIYDAVLKVTERVTNNQGAYILNWEDPFLMNNGIIDLLDQGIKIIQGLFTDNFSLNYAIISPGGSFYHDHKYLWEYHFIDEYSEKCLYEHYRADKKYAIDDNDIISMAPTIAHGGNNPENSISFKLGFVAGNTVYGPWRFDFNDRGSPSKDKLEKVGKIESVNGVHLDALINEVISISEGNHVKQVNFPSNECEAPLKIIKVKDKLMMQPLKNDIIIKVLNGSGTLRIFENLQQTLRMNDSFIVPREIQCSLNSSDMLLLAFG